VFSITRRLDSVGPTGTFLLLTDHTGIINIGSDASFIRLGSATTPPRTAYVPLTGQDLCNKTYVDSMSGSGLLSATNVWTGPSITFNNVVNVNSISAPSGTLTVPSNITGSDIFSTSGSFDNPTAAATCRFARTTTTGDVNIGQNQTTGSLRLGTNSARTGAINIGATGSTTTINGNLNCEGYTNIGTTGTPYRCMIMGSTGAGLSGSNVVSIPGAPTTFGNPILFTSINVGQGNDINMYTVNAIVLNEFQFRYRKRRWNGAVLADASTESINYIAYWL